MKGMGMSSTSTSPARAPERMQAAAKAGSGCTSDSATVRNPTTWSTTSVRSLPGEATTIPRCRLKGMLGRAKQGFLRELDRFTLADCLEKSQAFPALDLAD